MTPRLPLSGPLGLSLAAVALVAIFALVAIPSLLIAAFGPGTGASEPGEEIARLMAEHDKNAKSSQERFNGRSVFFRPPPKYVPPPPAPATPDLPPPPPPGPPPPPASYTGPSLKAILGDTAWFMPPAADEPPLYLKVGDTDSKSGVMLVSTNPPWSVHVTHKGGEYDIDLFKKSWEQFFNGSATPSTSPIPGLLIQPPTDPNATPSAGANADRISGRNVATPVVQPLTVEPNAKAEAGKTDSEESEDQPKEKADDSAETEETTAEDPEDADEEEEEPSGKSSGALSAGSNYSVGATLLMMLAPHSTQGIQT